MNLLGSARKQNLFWQKLHLYAKERNTEFKRKVMLVQKN